VVWQTGSGTQTNMNANEVIANVASELARHEDPPNESREHVAVVERRLPDGHAHRCAKQLAHRLVPAVARLRAAITDKSEAFADVVKIGRTHLMDATRSRSVRR